MFMVRTFPAVTLTVTASPTRVPAAVVPRRMRATNAVVDVPAVMDAMAQMVTWASGPLFEKGRDVHTTVPAVVTSVTSVIWSLDSNWMGMGAPRGWGQVTSGGRAGWMPIG